MLVADPSGTDERLLPWAQAATWVQAREREADVRWVWPDTASLYPRLLSAGVRVARCHDLRLCHTILALATAEPWPAPTWLTAQAEPTAPSLLDDLEGLGADRPGRAQQDDVGRHARASTTSTTRSR